MKLYAWVSWIKRRILGNPQTSSASDALAALIRGIEFHQGGDFQSSLEASQQALDLYQSKGDQRGEGAAWGNLGLAYQGLGQYQQALACHQKSLKIAEASSNQQAKASSLGNIGLVYYYMGNYGEAANYHEKHLKLARAINDAQGIANAFGNIGMVYDSLGQYSKAMEYHLQALEVKRKLGDRQGEASTLGNIGVVYYSIGQYKKALDSHLQHLKIANEIGDQFSEGAALTSIGNTYYFLGQPDKALEYYQKHLEIARSIGDTFGEGSALCNLGNVYQSLKQYENAIEYYQCSADITQKIGDKQGEGCAYNSLGLVHLFLGEIEKAMPCFEKAFSISNQIGDLAVKAAALDSLGNASQVLERYDDAIKLHKLALEINHEIGDIEGIGTTSNNLGNTFLRCGMLAEAESTLKDSIHFWKTLRTDLEDIQKISLIETQKTAYSLLQEVLVQQNKIYEALEISELGRTQAFIELILGRYSKPISQETNSKLTSASVTFTGIQQLAQKTKITIVEYSIIKDNLLYIWVIQPSGEIAFQEVNYADLIESNRMSSLQELISKAYEEIGIQGLYRGDVGKEIEPGITSKSYSLLQALHKYLIRPIAQYLPNNLEDVTVVIPHDDLFLIPFHALHDEDGLALLEKHTLLTVPSIQTLELLIDQHFSSQTSRIEQTALVVGNPTMPSVPVQLGEEPQLLAALPGAEAEARAIADLLKVEAIIGNSATKSSIEEALSKARLIHLATHGLLDDIRQLGIPGAIALAPSENDTGLLCADEIINFQMEAELVVLSACVTGLGRLTGDGVVGLSRSFLAAGVTRLIVSLWAVSDITSALLMVKLHKLLKQKNNLQLGDTARILRQAQLWLKSLDIEQAKTELILLQPYIEEVFRSRPRVGQAYINRYFKDLESRAPYPFADPTYWAPFVTIGL